MLSPPLLVHVSATLSLWFCGGGPISYVKANPLGMAQRTRAGIVAADRAAFDHGKLIGFSQSWGAHFEPSKSKLAVFKCGSLLPYVYKHTNEKHYCHA